MLIFAAVALVAVTAVPHRGRWAYQSVWLWLALWYRSHARAATGDDGSPEAAVLAAVDRTSRISHMTVDGAEVGVVEHAGGTTAVVELGTGDVPLGLEPALLPLPAALLPDDEAGPPVTIQLLMQVTPAPSTRAGDSPAAVSYRELTGGHVPARFHAWLAVQIVRAPEAIPSELRQDLSHVLRRLLRRLRRDLVAARALDMAGLRATLATAAHLDVTAASDDDGDMGAERWGAWWTRDVAHVSFHVNQWPHAADDGRLMRLLLETECLAVTMSLAAGNAAAHAGAEHDDVAVQLTTRLAASDAPELTALAGQHQERLAGIGAVAERMDGRQIYGLAATLPLGGFLP